MKEKFKLYGGTTLALFMIACAGQNENNAVSLSSVSHKAISAKSFLTMAPADQQEVLNHFQKKCDEPAILAGVQDDRYLNITNKNSDFCFKVCKINSRDPIVEGGTTSTVVSTQQLAVGLNDLNKYIETEDKDGADDLIGECDVVPPCHLDGGPIMPMSSGTQATLVQEQSYCSGPIIYEGQPGSVEGNN